MVSALIHSSAAAGGASALAGLTDVNIPAPADNEVLTYDLATGKWISAAPAGGGAMATDPLWDALGDLAYGTGADTGAKLAGQTTVIKLVLTQTGNGAISAAPVWGHPNALWDADHDTGIQVEEAADEDIIRFDIAGVGNLMTLQAGGLDLNAHSAFGANAALDTSKVLAIQEDAIASPTGLSYGLYQDVGYAGAEIGNALKGFYLYARNKTVDPGTMTQFYGLQFFVSHESARSLTTAYGISGKLESTAAGTGAWTVGYGMQVNGAYAGAKPATVYGFRVFAAIAPAGVTTAYGIAIGDLQATNGIGIDVAHFTIDSGIRLGIRNASAYAATPSTVQVLAAGTAIVADAETVQFSLAGDVTSTAAPTIADGQDGQILSLVNVDDASHYVLTDQNHLANSNLRLSAATITLHPGDSIQLRFNATIGDWLEEGVTIVHI